MPLDPQAQALLDLAEQNPRPLYETLSAEAARKQYEEVAAAMKATGRKEVVPEPFETRDIKIPGPEGTIEARLYKARSTEESPLPMLVFFHGGGYVLGSPESHDVVCRYLCVDARCLVVSVDYRLAPEHPFPAAVDDAWAATCWVAEHAPSLGGDAQRLALGGDSAGGNLAAVVCQIAKTQLSKARRAPDIDFQLLIYPGTDLTCSFPSHQTYAEGYRLTQPLIAWFMRHYLGGHVDPRDPRVSPLLNDDLADLPPALILSAGFDPLKDEDMAYADKLRDAGVPVETAHYEGMMHGFITLPNHLDKAREALAVCARALRDALD